MAELTKAVIEEWVRGTDGWWDIAQLDRDLNLDPSAATKSKRRVILHRLVSEGILKRHPDQNGKFKLVTADATIVDWRNADVSNTIDIMLPFGLEQWVTIYPKNLILIAGAPNSGKSAICLNIVALNMNRPNLDNFKPIEYFTSEMGPEELKLRLSKFPAMEWNFVARERNSGFADVIKPDKINIIDYLEVTDNFYMVADELNEIFTTLTTGIAIVALQKKIGARLGRGAEFSLEKPRLYLSLDNNRLTIEKGKNWAQPGVNPNGKKWTFKLVDGWHFCNIKEVHDGTE